MGSIKITVSENKLRKRAIYKEMSHVANSDYGDALRSLTLDTTLSLKTN